MATNAALALPHEILEAVCDAIDADVQSQTRGNDLLHLGLCCNWLYKIASKRILNTVFIRSSGQLKAFGREIAKTERRKEVHHFSARISESAETGPDEEQAIAGHHLYCLLEACSALSNLVSLDIGHIGSNLMPAVTWLLRQPLVELRCSLVMVASSSHRDPGPRASLRKMEIELDVLHARQVEGMLRPAINLEDFGLVITRRFDDDWSGLALPIAVVGPHLRKLSVSVPPSEYCLPVDGFGVSIAMCPALEVLNSSGFDFEQREVQALPPTLKRLEASHRYVDWEALLQRLESGNLPALESLRFNNSRSYWCETADKARERLREVCRIRGLAMIDENRPPSFSDAQDVAEV